MKQNPMHCKVLVKVYTF